eukprot:c18473_g1_i1.p1 GENE.c18473_g1_i1~~c18473_g1_i1.p1  ORF type:complete len:389 (+),score=79.05 c18473_g1_i1:37-1167(+)
MADLIHNQPIVIDNGTGLLKAGIAGERDPSIIIPTMVGRTKHKQAMLNKEFHDLYVGSEAMNHRSVLKLSYAMEHGIVQNWEDMEKIWSHLYSNHLKLSSEEHPVLLTEAPLNPLQNRERAAEIFFETFTVPALFFSMQAVLSLYASGRTTGLVLDSGDGVTHCVPVYEGFSMQNAITRIDVAGRDVTDYLQLLLRKAGHVFHTSAEREVVRTIKEKTCYVAYKAVKEEDTRNVDEAKKQAFKLPDGNVLNMNTERFRAPEILFRPSIIGSEYPGVHEAIHESILKTDLEMRRELYGSIVFSGGSTLFLGFGDRVLAELHKLAPNAKIRISAPPDRHLSTWAGGSILASLSTFKLMWTSKSEYLEHGVNVVHRKTF